MGADRPSNVTTSPSGAEKTLGHVFQLNDLEQNKVNSNKQILTTFGRLYKLNLFGTIITCFRGTGTDHRARPDISTSHKVLSTSHKV